MPVGEDREERPAEGAWSPSTAVGQVRDGDGFADLGDYGVLGDGRGAALVARDGTVDWWAAPRLDSTPVFAALLDPEHGGRAELRPVDADATVEQHYVPGTNQLCTEYVTAGGRVRVTDSLNSGHAGALPWSELGRRVEGLEGEVEMLLAVRPGTGLGRWEPWAQDLERSVVLHSGPLMIAVRTDVEPPLEVTGDGVDARFTITAGERRVVGLVCGEEDPVVTCAPDAVDRRIDLTTESWRRWTGELVWDGPADDRVLRSALALKTLVVAHTGAVAAAATTSLPERVGGEKNWDYRFTWVRDAALTIDAFALLRMDEEVQAAMSWLLHAVRRNGRRMHVLYTLDGDLPQEERQPDVPGYRHSRPVNVGNRASGQTQLGTYGDLFGTVCAWVEQGNLLDVGSARELADIADECADTWRQDDAGIWELTTERPYTFSKMGCWRALDAAARLADGGHLAGDGRAWRGEAQRVRRWVGEHCWSERRQAYTFYAGSEDLDAAVLLGADIGFDRSWRMSCTIDAIGAELGAGPLLYRYSGMREEEQTFVACAYWRVHALVAVGRRAEAAELLGDLDRLAIGPLGLMSEMVTPGGSPVGNLPQALSHLAHIRATAAVHGVGG